MSDRSDLSVAILSLLTATLVSVMMAGGVPTWLDTMVGLLPLFACLHYRSAELTKGFAAGAYAIALGGAVYLILSVLIMPILVLLEQTDLAPIVSCSADYYATPSSALFASCAEPLYALIWAFASLAAFAVLKISARIG